MMGGGGKGLEGRRGGDLTFCYELFKVRDVGCNGREVVTQSSTSYFLTVHITTSSTY
jgi:hypothetical protein